ncbi:hypothetical protein B484DRAFT_406003 [Ochromonadaceae sp. CCMP2298]|nr:hypothetical protein B484DRAFT_406003 [Ochromonadaceae sp. CCMP2298]
MERYLEPYFGPCMELVQNEKPTQDRANIQWRARIARELKEKEEKAEEARAKKAEKAAERQAKAEGGTRDASATHFLAARHVFALRRSMRLSMAGSGAE